MNPLLILLSGFVCGMGVGVALYEIIAYRPLLERYKIALKGWKIANTLNKL